MAVSRNWIMWVKTVVMLTGVFAMALFLKLSVPLIYRAPILWSLVISWMKPPYLYVVINGIIISIAVVSRFCGTIPDGDDQDMFINHEFDKIPVELNFSPKPAGIYFQAAEPPAPAEEEEEEKNVVAESITVVEEDDENQLHESLDDTWRKITACGKSTPLIRELKGLDTWKNQGRSMMKVKVRKEVVLSQDELTRRAEEFIRKFNEDMRLQKIESLRRSKEMV